MFVNMNKNNLEIVSSMQFRRRKFSAYLAKFSEAPITVSLIKAKVLR